MLNLIKNQSTDEMNKNLSKGSIDAILDIKKNDAMPPFTIDVQYTKASSKGGILKSTLNNTLYQMNSAMNKNQPQLAEVKETTIQGREYRYIDFILPGMLGFSLLSSGVFGTAFVFLSLRLTLVIKRFFATPVKRYSIVLGEALARIVFALLGALFIIIVGHYIFNFTLIHGFATVVNMLILSTIGLISPVHVSGENRAR